MPAPPRTERALLLAAPAAAFAVALTGCGGSGSKSTAATRSRSATIEQPSGGGAATTTGAVRARLIAPSHSPIANKPWAYTVLARDASGRPLTGTVDTQFLFSGQVVGRETPPTHRLTHGRLYDVITWPPRAVGEPLTLQAVVHTAAGTVSLDWPVSVRP